MSSAKAPGATTVAGIDRWRKGWVVALCSPGGTTHLHETESIIDTLDLTAQANVVAIDMPMSLPVQGRREAEELLRAHLGSAGRSVFYSPTEVAIGCPDRASADVVNRQAGGGGISAQSWGLAASIREVRSALIDHPLQSRWRETHPESSFVAMRPSEPLASKRSALGATQRLQLLAREFGDVLAIIERDRPAAPLDDVLDALAAAWSARRIAAGTAVLFGPPGHDAHGFPHGIQI